MSAEAYAARSRHARSSPSRRGRGCAPCQDDHARPDVALRQQAPNGLQEQSEFRLRVNSTGMPEQRALATIGRIMLAALDRLEGAERAGSDA